MQTDTAQRIANAKAIVLSVLSGRITPESDPAAFEEDAVYMSVRITELHDPDWLLHSIAETDRSSEGILYVMECIGSLRDQAEALLRPPDECR